MNKNDRRVKRTKKAIINAFADLMLAKDINSITVKELTERADIHRATFYSHYEDVYDLYSQIRKNVADDLAEIITSNSLNDYKYVFEKIIEYTAENKSVCKMLFFSENCEFFQKQICDLTEKKYLEIAMLTEHKIEIREEWNYIAEFYIHGMVALISKWIKSDFSYPQNKVVELMNDLDLCIDKAFADKV